ncbi:MAG: hypothetical protein DRI26_06040 [Chloroflexi bacterium]|nr:MAG: hypothetical protein DRI26_06040 [Chloroflexota bacterium]
MTEEELEKAIYEANEEIKNLARPTGPLPEREVRRREMLLLKQATLYKIEDARKQNRKRWEAFNIELYGLITSILTSY